jgi:hypothetical protein
MYFGERCMGWKIILTWIVEKWVAEMSTGFNRRLGPVAGSWDGNEPYVSIIETFSLYSRITVKLHKESHD